MGPVTDEDLSDTTAMAPHNRVIVRQCEAAGVTAVVRRHDIAGQIRRLAVVAVSKLLSALDGLNRACYAAPTIGQL